MRDRIAGVVMVARTVDKAKAKANGNIGEYHFNCPMDQGVLGFLGIDHEAFLEKVRAARDDAEIEQYVRSFAERKSPAEIEAWNDAFLASAPTPGSESEGYFYQLREQVAPERTDVTNWADLLDLDEKRPVPQRVAAG